MGNQRAAETGLAPSSKEAVRSMITSEKTDKYETSAVAASPSYANVLTLGRQTQPPPSEQRQSTDNAAIVSPTNSTTTDDAKVLWTNVEYTCESFLANRVGFPVEANEQRPVVEEQTSPAKAEESPQMTRKQSLGPTCRVFPSMYRDTTFTKIFVGGLPYTTVDADLKQYFSKFGEIEEAVVITDRNTRKSRGYGFVTFKAKEAAARACAETNPTIEGRKANVSLAYLGAKPRLNLAAFQQKLGCLPTSSAYVPSSFGATPFPFTHSTTQAAFNKSDHDLTFLSTAAQRGLAESSAWPHPNYLLTAAAASLAAAGFLPPPHLINQQNARVAQYPHCVNNISTVPPMFLSENFYYGTQHYPHCYRPSLATVSLPAATLLLTPPPLPTSTHFNGAVQRYAV